MITQTLADEIANSVQAGIDISISPEYGVDQVAAVQTAVDELGLTLLALNQHTVTLPTFEELQNSDVILFDEAFDAQLINEVLELTAHKTRIIRTRDSIQGFLAIN